jgi:hypothetical protein
MGAFGVISAIRKKGRSCNQISMYCRTGDTSPVRQSDRSSHGVLPAAGIAGNTDKVHPF